jgi:hypothetical protein
MSCCDTSGKYPCPNKMADGRSFTDYRPRCNINYDLMQDLTKNNIINSSYESRLYLQQNAEKIMELNRNNAINNLAPCAPCNKSGNDTTMLPEKYIVKCDAITCKREEINPNGLGDGRNYFTN